MGCGGSKSSPVTDPKGKKKKDIYAEVKGDTGPKEKRNVYDRKMSEGAKSLDGEEMPERSPLGRAIQLKTAEVTASVVNTYKDIKFGRGQEDFGDEELTESQKQRFYKWLAGLPPVGQEKPIKVIDIVDRPGTPVDYYQLPQRLSPRNVNRTEQPFGAVPPATPAVASEGLPQGPPTDQPPRPADQNSDAPTVVSWASQGTCHGDPEEALELTPDQQSGLDKTVPKRLCGLFLEQLNELNAKLKAQNPQGQNPQSVGSPLKVLKQEGASSLELEKFDSPPGSPLGKAAK